MNKVLTAACLFISQISLSQKNYKTVQFDKFVTQRGIEWAADASDTFNFSKSGINTSLLKRLKNNEIKASVAEVSRKNRPYSIQYSSFEDIFSYFYFPHGNTIYDSLGNVVEQDKKIPEVDTLEFKYTEITQILYVENGVLKSYVPMVTPTLSLYLTTGKYIGETFYFTTAFNLKYNYKPSKRDKILFLQETTKGLKFPDAENNLKEMFGNNLIQTLWPHVLSGKIELYNAATNKKANPAELNTTLHYQQQVLSPIYDSINAIIKFETVVKSANPKDFSHALMVQDWYYNESENIVFNRIKELYLYANKATQEADAQSLPVLKLVFK